MRGLRQEPLALAIALLCGAGCTSRGSGGSGASTGSAASSSGSGSGGSSGVASGGSTSGGSTGSDAGCNHPGHVAELGACVLSADCQCPLACLPDPDGKLLCLPGCSDSADCVGGELCDAGLCVVELACDPLAGGTDFERCKVVTDCLCPFECFGDERLGSVCERPCDSDADCLEPRTFCESDAGSCQVAVGCDPGLSAASEFGKCSLDSDCRCPLECVYDPLRGSACERTCATAADCGDAGETCRTSGDGGSCSLACTPGLTSAFAPCRDTVQCPCPMTCQFFPDTYTALCLSCDGGTCAPPPGACIDAGPEAAASQSLLPPDRQAAGVVACASNADCYCPNECLPFNYYGEVSFICQAAVLPCTSFEDCPDPTQACLLGMCLPNDCSEDASVGDSCDPSRGENAARAGTGVCLLATHGVGLVCSQGGDGGAGCSLSPDRDNPGSLCPAGMVCVPGDAGTFCAPGCSGDFGSCDAGSCSRLQPAPVSACPDCYGGLACLPDTVNCTEDLPTYLPVDGPFDEASVGVEYARCYGTACRCPLACVGDPAFGQAYDCERPCRGSSDCPLPQSSCIGGFCGLSSGGCALDGGLALGAACDAGDGPGTCLYFLPFAVQPYLSQVAPAAVCRADGTATAQCDPAASRAGPGVCGAGSDCMPLPDGGFGCRPLCDPRVAGECPAGQGCFPLTNNPGDFNEGTCVSLGDAGCSLALPSNELAACLVASDCACGLACVATSPFQSLCMRPCTKVTDCAEDEVCYGEAGNRFCRLNTCSLGSSSSTICDGDVGADGTCLAVTSVEQPDAFPHTALGAQALIDICHQAGTATRSCDPAADHSAPSLLCVPGAFCDTSGPVPTCTPLCVDLPDGGHVGSPCGRGQYCVPMPVYLRVAIGFSSVVEGECLPALPALDVDGGT